MTIKHITFYFVLMTFVVMSFSNDAQSCINKFSKVGSVTSHKPQTTTRLTEKKVLQKKALAIMPQQKRFCIPQKHNMHEMRGALSSRWTVRLILDLFWSFYLLKISDCDWLALGRKTGHRPSSVTSLWITVRLASVVELHYRAVTQRLTVSKVSEPWNRLPRARGICYAAEPGLFTGVRPLNPHLPSKLFWLFWPGIPLIALSFTLCICLSVYPISLSFSVLNTGCGEINSHVLVLRWQHSSHVFSLTLISEETNDNIRRCRNHTANCCLR